MTRKQPGRDRPRTVRGYTVNSTPEGQYTWKTGWGSWRWDWNTRALHRDGVVVGTGLMTVGSAVMWSEGYDIGWTDRGEV
jgi:hypothetical protein